MTKPALQVFEGWTSDECPIDWSATEAINGGRRLIVGWIWNNSEGSENKRIKKVRVTVEWL